MQCVTDPLYVCTEHSGFAKFSILQGDFSHDKYISIVIIVIIIVYLWKIITYPLYMVLTTGKQLVLKLL